MPPGDRGHRNEKCRHGRTFLTCRCVGPKAEVVVDCPLSCLEAFGERLLAADEYDGKHRAEAEL
jgi:hypothetical protein